MAAASAAFVVALAAALFAAATSTLIGR